MQIELNNAINAAICVPTTQTIDAVHTQWVLNRIEWQQWRRRKRWAKKKTVPHPKLNSCQNNYMTTMTPDLAELFDEQCSSLMDFWHISMQKRQRRVSKGRGNQKTGKQNARNGKRREGTKIAGEKWSVEKKMCRTIKRTWWKSVAI